MTKKKKSKKNIHKLSAYELLTIKKKSVSSLCVQQKYRKVIKMQKLIFIFDEFTFMCFLNKRRWRYAFLHRSKY